MVKRIRKPITITLSLEAQDGLEVLKKEKQDQNVSKIIDEIIVNAVTNLGYKIEKVQEMFYQVNQVEVSLVSDGNELKKFSSNDGQQFIQVPSLGKYEIKIKNKSAQRKLVIVSIDGRNIMDGETAGYDGGGYVLSPWETLQVKGWRRNDQEVAAFEFVDLQSSYDKQMGGTGSNVGVIGVAVFDEYIAPTLMWIKPSQPQPYWWSTTESFSKTLSTNTNNSRSLGTLKNNLGELISSDGFDNNSINVMDSNIMGTSVNASNLETVQLGTGYGSKTEMKTTYTTFQKASVSPKEIIVLRYATEPMLRKWGVIREPLIPVVDPFPKEKAAVPAPPGWKG